MALLFAQASSEVQILGEPDGCVAFEEEGQVFMVKSERIIIIDLDLSPSLPSKYRDGYAGDGEGKQCLSQIQGRLNSTMGIFVDKMQKYHDSILMMDEYRKEMTLHLTSVKASVKGKRSAGAAALALAIVDLVAIGAGYF